MGVIVLVFCLRLYRSLCIVGLLRQLSGKESVEMRHRFDPWVGKKPWRKKWQPTQYSCQDNPKDRGAWWAIVYGVTKSRTWLSNWTLYIVIFFKHYLIWFQSYWNRQFIVINSFSKKENLSQGFYSSLFYFLYYLSKQCLLMNKTCPKSYVQCFVCLTPLD